MTPVVRGQPGNYQRPAGGEFSTDPLSSRRPHHRHPIGRRSAGGRTGGGFSAN